LPVFFRCLVLAAPYFLSCPHVTCFYSSHSCPHGSLHPCLPSFLSAPLDGEASSREGIFLTVAPLAFAFFVRWHRRLKAGTSFPFFRALRLSSFPPALRFLAAPQSTSSSVCVLLFYPMFRTGSPKKSALDKRLPDPSGTPNVRFNLVFFSILLRQLASDDPLTSQRRGIFLMACVTVAWSFPSFVAHAELTFSSLIQYD